MHQALLLATLFAICNAACPTKGRLLISDYVNPQVHVVELDSQAPSIVASLNVTERRAALYPTKSGAFGAVVHRTADTVQFVSSGISGTQKSAPTLSGYKVQGPYPTHFVSNNGKIAIFFDGTPGTNVTSGAEFITESTLASGVPEVLRFEQFRTHHGVAIPGSNNYYIISIKNPQSRVSASLPDGFHVFDSNRTMLEDLNKQDDHHASCQGYHGSGHIKNYYVFGCASISSTDENHGGVLIVKYDRQTADFTSWKVGYHDQLVDTRAGTFTYHPDRTYWIGNYDTTTNGVTTAQGFIRVHLDATDFDSDDLLKPLNYTRCSFAQDLELGYLVVLASNGNVYIYTNPEDWRIPPTVVPVLPPFSCSGSQLHPDTRMTVDKGYAYVSAYINETVIAQIDLHLATFPVSRFSIPAEVFSMTVIGVDPSICNLPTSASANTAAVPTSTSPAHSSASPVPSSAISKDADSSATSLGASVFLAVVTLLL